MKPLLFFVLLLSILCLASAAGENSTILQTIRSIWERIKDTMKPTTFELYDVIVHIDSMFQLETEGWKVTYKNQSSLENTFNIESRILSILGLYNRGKTWILSNICNTYLETGIITHTIGLSLAVPSIENQNIILLDTSGKSTPISGNTKYGLLDKKATENFLENVVFHMSDIVLVVVNSLTWNDQLYLNSLLKQHNRDKRKIIVVHNLKEIKSIEEFQKQIETDLVYCYGARHVRQKLYRDRPDVVDYYESENFLHIVLAQHGSPAGVKHNSFGFRLLFKWITDSIKFKKLHLVNQLVDFTNRMLPLYFKNDELKVVYSAEPYPRIHLVNPQPLIYRDLLWSDTGLVIARDMFDPAIDTFQNSTHYTIISDIPGVAKETVTLKMVVDPEENVDVLKITGERSPIVIQSESLNSGRTFGKFNKFIKFKTRIDYHKGIEKRLDNGILTVTVAKFLYKDEL
jgi:HSP20 family molecular chaperone IbpA